MNPSPLPAAVIARVANHPLLSRELEAAYPHIHRVEALCDKYEWHLSCAGCAHLVFECIEHLQDTLGRFLEFLSDHFMEEEAYMKARGCAAATHPDYAAHVEDHARITAEILRIITAIGTTQTVVLIADLRKLMDDMWHRHFIQHDLSIAELETRH
ncbi:hypothetical protein G3580_02485 [Nitrogeniibacter mangrovi]|uniref:Hemerythrin-like domain-containing protein n=1 Tax=Nitrogeniibacter mangrovi TaxID=2016596 RepID=A0A6C1AZ09_9RHOO|nr:hypothetical protein [Nitrogeniibacter mangrovi]QID16592.1 hypothetical protein G3580_02485 [Nitrogeniibacter mangrovi]